MHTTTSTTGNVFYGPGVRGQAAYFPNAQGQSVPLNWVSVPNANNVPLSFALWHQQINPGDYETILGLTSATAGGGCTGIQLDSNTNGKYAADVSLPSAWTAAAAGPVGTSPYWTHLAVTVSSSFAVKLYINGTFRASAQGAATIPSECTTTWDVGRSAVDNNRGYNGYVDEFRVYSGVLSDAQVRQDMVSAFQ